MPSPSLLARLSSGVPRPIAAAVAKRMFNVVLRGHPAMFDRLGEHARKRYAFVPAEFPFAFVIEPARRTLRVLPKSAPVHAHASAAGSLVLLLALLEGRSDGDAAFFARDLTVSGDMEAMVALRNALDDCGVDLPRDLAASAGVFGPLFMRAGNALRERALGRQVGQWS
jgi:predicted lipid carrier protein YhbT